MTAPVQVPQGRVTVVHQPSEFRRRAGILAYLAEPFHPFGLFEKQSHDYDRSITMARKPTPTFEHVQGPLAQEESGNVDRVRRQAESVEIGFGNRQDSAHLKTTRCTALGLCNALRR